MKKLLCSITLFLTSITSGCITSGCGFNRQEQIAFGILIGGQAADYFTTTRNLDAGARELNPILDDHPHDDEVLLFKVGVVGVTILLGELDKEHREAWYWIGGLSGFGATAFNQYTYDHERP